MLHQRAKNALDHAFGLTRETALLRDQARMLVADARKCRDQTATARALSSALRRLRTSR